VRGILLKIRAFSHPQPGTLVPFTKNRNILFSNTDSGGKSTSIRRRIEALWFEPWVGQVEFAIRAAESGDRACPCGFAASGSTVVERGIEAEQRIVRRACAGFAN